MSTKKESPRDDPKKWCVRCQERESSPEPANSLINPKHEKFCRNLTIGKMPGYEAYMEAGFSTKNKSVASTQARRLKKRIEIASRIEYLLSMTIEMDFKTREYVEQGLKDIFERCMQAKPHKDKSGKPDGQWYFDAANANKAIWAMGKDLGMFVEKLEVKGIDAELHGKTDAQVQEVVVASFNDLGRPVCIQIMEKAFGIKYEGGDTDADGGDTPQVESVSPLH